MGSAVQAVVGATSNLHHLLAIPTTGIGAILVEGNPARSQGVSTSGGNQNTGTWMFPNEIHRLEQHPMLPHRSFPTLRANSGRHTQTKLALLQQDQLTA